MRLVSLSLLFVSLAVCGCSSAYVAKPGTPNNEINSNVASAQGDKETRVQAEIDAAAKAEAEGEAAWKQSHEDHLASLSPKRAKWFRAVLTAPRVTIGMSEAEVKLLIHWKIDAKIVVSKADGTDRAKAGEVTVWSNVPLDGPKGGGHKGPLTITFRKGKVVSVSTPRG